MSALDALEVTSPATLIDMAELGRVRSRNIWAAARRMLADGHSFAVRDGERLVAVAGLYPIDREAGAYEAWLNLAPGAGALLWPLLGQIRLTLAAGGYRSIVVLCTTKAGAVMARRAGFAFAEPCELGELWTWPASST